jgi:KDO2-lipid IV(A) lauroyltransferase
LTESSGPVPQPGARLRRPSYRRRRARSEWIQRLEYLSAGLIIPVLHYVPPARLRRLTSGLAWLADRLMPGRNKIATANLQLVFQREKSQKEIETIARKSNESFILSFAEHLWFRRLLNSSDGLQRIQSSLPGLNSFEERVKSIHDQTSGCIFVTAHLGCYGLLPYLFTAFGVPSVIPLNREANDPINRRWCPLNDARRPGGEIFISKHNSLLRLKQALREGRSVGMMADQRAMGGLAVPFLDVVAPTTTAPALLAVLLKRPIVVVACCRLPEQNKYELILREPIWPRPGQDRDGETVRLTEELNWNMGEIIRRYPEQYLWMHNRWKPYRQNRSFARPISVNPE